MITIAHTEQLKAFVASCVIARAGYSQVSWTVLPSQGVGPTEISIYAADKEPSTIRVEMSEGLTPELEQRISEWIEQLLVNW